MFIFLRLFMFEAFKGTENNWEKSFLDKLKDKGLPKLKS